MVIPAQHPSFCYQLQLKPVPCNSSILHLSRPMTKLCLSSLFSISPAEFYSSNNLTNNQLNKQTNNYINILYFVKHKHLFVYQVGSFILHILILSQFFLSKLTKKACRLVKKVTVSLIDKMERRFCKSKDISVAAVAVVLIVLLMMSQMMLCLLLQMGAMDG